MLKTKSECYKPSKAKILTVEEITRYLIEAPDEQFLLEKVILIFGIFGSCRREELVMLRVDNIEDTGRLIIVTLENIENKSYRKFAIMEDDTPFKGCKLYRRYAALRPSCLENQRFFVDYRNGKCTKQFVGIHRIGGVPKKIAEYLKLENPEAYTGHSFKKSAANTLLTGNKGDQLKKRWKSPEEESINKKMKIVEVEVPKKFLKFYASKKSFS